jgi:hypothetical protein
MEELQNIQIDLSNLESLNTEERASGNTDRLERRSRRNLGRNGFRNQSVRNGERRRRQPTTSNVIREAATLGAALGRVANARTRAPGQRMRQRRRQNQQENANNQSTEDSTNPNNGTSVEDPQIVEPLASSSMLPSNIDENVGNEDKNTEHSNSSWEDFSEEEVVGSADNSGVLNDNSIAEENEEANPDID